MASVCRPVLPKGRQLPWILGIVSVSLLLVGLTDGNDMAFLIGGLGSAATFIGFILPRLLLPAETPESHPLETPDEDP